MVGHFALGRQVRRRCLLCTRAAERSSTARDGTGEMGQAPRPPHLPLPCRGRQSGESFAVRGDGGRLQQPPPRGRSQTAALPSPNPQANMLLKTTRISWRRRHAHIQGCLQGGGASSAAPRLAVPRLAVTHPGRHTRAHRGRARWPSAAGFRARVRRPKWGAGV